MKEPSEINKSSTVEGVVNVGSVKYCETDEEIDKYINSAKKMPKIPKGVESSSVYESQSPEVIITLGDSIQWTKDSPEPKKHEPKEAKKTLTDRISQWVTNFVYNAKVGNNIWSAVLGDQKLDQTHDIRLLTENYALGTKEGHAFFLDAFRNLVWMTYRTDFSPILGTSSASVMCDLSGELPDSAAKKLYSSDNGWGCTIRVGQTALANALVRHIYNRCFSVQLMEKQGISGTLYKKIIMDFWDNGRGKEYPFSIQNFCERALKYKKFPGEWLSQSMVATIFRDLNKRHKPYQDLEVLVFVDGAIYKDRLGVTAADEETASTKGFEFIEKKEYDENEEEKSDGSKVIFVSCALGMKNPEPMYLNRFKDLFDFQELIGIMGGRTNEALFFVGCQDDNLLFLDPHFVQLTVSEASLDKQYTSYHCTSPKLLNYGKIDTSICAVFYVKDKAELMSRFLPSLEKYVMKPNSLLQLYKKSPEISQFDDDDFDDLPSQLCD